MTSPNNHSTEERTSLIAEFYAFEELTRHCKMVPANGSLRDRQGAHEDWKQTSANSVEAENPEAFQQKLKNHAYYLQII